MPVGAQVSPGDVNLTDGQLMSVGVQVSSGLNDVQFDWDRLDSDEFSKAAALPNGVKISGSSFEAVKNILEREFKEAAESNEEVEIYIRRSAKESNGWDHIDAFGDMSPNKTVGLIDEGSRYRIKHGVTMASGCSVFVMPSGWLGMFELEESEGSRRGQTFQAAGK